MTTLTKAELDAKRKRFDELACWRMAHGLTRDEREEFNRLADELEQALEESDAYGS